MFSFVYKNKDTGKTECFIEALEAPSQDLIPVNLELIGVIDITTEFEARRLAQEEEQQGG